VFGFFVVFFGFERKRGRKKDEEGVSQTQKRNALQNGCVGGSKTTNWGKKMFFCIVMKNRSQQQKILFSVSNKQINNKPPLICTQIH
jgi:hypothetical protein